MPPVNTRAIAARQLADVIGRGKAYEPTQPDTAELDGRDRGLVREICFGTLRHYFLLSAVVDSYLKKPLARKDSDVYALLLTGLYQLRFMGTPAHAAINASVDACKTLKKPWATGLVNAVLRKLARECCDEALPEPIKQKLSEAATHSHPDWLYSRLQQDWPAQLANIVDYNNAPPPMTLRVNGDPSETERYQLQLREQGVEASANALCKSALTLDKPIDVKSLPGFSEGAASVQDAAAQLAAGLLELAPEQRVLDACAAPGGKSIHALQHCPGIELTALDSQASRLEKLQADLLRCQLQATTVCADATEPNSWWNGQPFDRILLDAPCSGTGVIAHHPDIKLLRRPGDIDSFAEQQQSLLDALWPLLNLKGKLLYCTCSIIPEENRQVIEKFLQRNPDARLETLAIEGAIDTGCGHQLLPIHGKNAGFFYARLSKLGQL